VVWRRPGPANIPRGDRGIGALVSSLACQLPAHFDDGGAAHRARLGTAVLDVVTAALATRLGRAEDVPPESRRRLERCRSDLQDPAESPRRLSDS
jgi:hypothetical protein